MAGGNGRCLIRDEIVSFETYIDLLPSSRDLYIQLLVKADYEGFVGRIKTENAMNIVKAKPKNLKELKEKGYIIEFASKVTLIVHWWKLNTWDDRESKRKQNQTLYQKEKSMVTLDENRLYRLIPNDLRMNCEGKETNIKERNIKENNKQTDPVRLVGLSDTSIYYSLTDTDKVQLQKECDTHNCDLVKLIKEIDTDMSNRKDPERVGKPYPYIIRIAKNYNWNPEEINKGFTPVNSSPEKVIKYYKDIEGSLWDNLTDSQQRSMKVQFEDNDITELTKAIDTLIKENPEEEYSGTEVSLFMKLAKKLI